MSYGSIERVSNKSKTQFFETSVTDWAYSWDPFEFHQRRGADEIQKKPLGDLGGEKKSNKRWWDELTAAGEGASKGAAVDVVEGAAHREAEGEP